MTGLDGLIEARSRQISDVVRRSYTRLLPGAGKSERETTKWQKFLGFIGTPEDILTKAIGSVFTSDDKYSFRHGVGYYNSQTSFADLFQSAGVDASSSAVLGIAASLLNPLDPLNKLKILQPTKLGVAAKAVTTNADNLIKEADGLWRISTKAVDKKLADYAKAIEQGAYGSRELRLAEDSVQQLTRQREEAAKLNDLLVELQKRNVDIKELRLAGSVSDQIRTGQMHLLGFGDLRSLEHVPGLGGEVRNASIYGLGGKGTAALVKSISNVKDAVLKPLGEYAYKVADYINIPTVRTEAQKKVASLLKTATNNSTSREDKTTTLVENTIHRFMDSYGEGGKAAAQNDLRAIVQGMEFKHDGIKQMVMSEIEKASDYKPQPLRNKGVALEQGTGLTPEQKARLSPAGVNDEDIPIAINQFDKANVTSTRLGIHKQHEMKLFGRYVVIKTSDPKTILSDLNDLDGIFANRTWAKHTRGGSTPVKTDPNKYYRSFEEPDEAIGGIRHSLKGDATGYGGGFTIEFSKDASKVYDAGTNQSKLSKINPDEVTRIFHQPDYWASGVTPPEYLEKLKKQFPKAEIIPVKLSDDEKYLLDIRNGLASEETFLIQKRHPSAQRITKTTDFEPAHLQNLEAIAAQLSRKKKGFTVMKPEDILVSPDGAVQIINPSIIADYKSAKNALANSRQVLDSLANDLEIPQGSLREFSRLSNTKAANSVPRGVDGFTFRKMSYLNVPENQVVERSAYDLLEEAVNTQGYRDHVRNAFGEETAATTEAIDVSFHPTDFERNNNIEFHRKQIRDQRAAGVEPHIEPISVMVDAHGNLHIANGRDRLTAAVLEGYDMVPVYRKNFLGEIDAEAGYIAGKTVNLRYVWNPQIDSSASEVYESTSKIVAPNYTLLDRNGASVKLSHQDIQIDTDFAGLLNRFVTVGPEYSAGTTRTARLQNLDWLLTQAYGSPRNAFLRISELAEHAPDAKTFAAALQQLLTNPNTKKPGMFLNNVATAPKAEELFIALRNSATRTLDNLAINGVLTTTTIEDASRVLMASDRSDLVVRVFDELTNSLKVYSNTATTEHLRVVADDFLNRTVSAADVDPYAKVKLTGANGVEDLEVKNFVETPHPKLAEVMKPVQVFNITDEHRKALKREGILVSNGEDVSNINNDLNKSGYFPKTEKGKPIGVLLQEKQRKIPSTETGRHYPGAPTETVIVRPEFTFFMTPSGSLVLGTKHRNVNDLLNVVFEEGPRYMQEFGLMTTGKVIVNNPFGGKLKKISYGEIAALQDRLKDMATRFKDLGLEDGTVMKVVVPFDDAVWRSMYGERVTIGDVLDDKFKIKIPDEIKGLEPDLQVLAPQRIGAEPMYVVGIEKTRQANEKMQKLFNFLEQEGDKLFLEQAKKGVPISYYESWFGRNLTQDAKTALSEMYLKYPDKESKTFKDFESIFKARVLTDLTTQEVNEVIKRFKKEGVDDPTKIIADVVNKYRDGYLLKPSVEQANILVSLSKILPEGIDFFVVDPMWSFALSSRQASNAMTRREFVDGLKNLGVALWHGTPDQLNDIKIGKSKEALRLDKEVNTLQAQLTKAELDYQNLAQNTPDLAGEVRHAELKQEIDRLTYKLGTAKAEKSKFLSDLGEGKVMDTMVDLESEMAWIRGEDVQGLVNKGVLKPSDILGDSFDAFVRVPIKKYAAMLTQENAEIFLFPKEVAGVVQRYFGSTTREGATKFFQLWDTVHAIWRNWTLFPIPAYHVRNFISNLFMAWLGGVTDKEVYAKAHGVLQIVNGYRKGSYSLKETQQALGAISFASVDGKVYTGQQVYDAFVHSGGMAGGLHRNEFTAFGTLARASEFEKATTRAGLRPSSELAGTWLYDNPALRLGVSAASFIENRFRFATFLDAVQKGHTEFKAGVTLTGFDAAAMQMKRVFYDYNDLSAFERSWLRRFIPFYSWSRHNIPRMLTTMITDPIKHYRVGQFFNELETGVNDGHPINEDELPEWLKEKYAILVDKTPQGNYVMKVMDGFLPMTDAYKALSVKGISNMLSDGITPFAKVPLEQILNYSTYTGKPIEAYPGQRAASYTLGEVGFSRRVTTEGPLGALNLVLNESTFRTFFRLGGDFATKYLDPILDSKEGPGIKLYLTGALVGKAYEINPEQARLQVFKDWRVRQRKLLGLHNSAVEQGDFNAANDTARMLTWLRLQNPGEKEL